ncbi:hypothetical protein C8J57DRAFT_1517369 [Mycena rebaudengoi]|nr:hypothetical protein C8J57DRAFT_1517369 [Mycena rebaudengoi]
MRASTPAAIFMITPRFIVAFLFLGITLGTKMPSGASNATRLSPDITPVSFVSNVAAIQASSGDTRIYYQNADNSIQAIAISGPFTTGALYISVVIVPTNQVQPNTLIAAAMRGDDFEEVHVFFISPLRILSEYIFTVTTNWRGGPNCTDCIDASQFVVQPGNRVLYAMENSAVGGQKNLRVGFVSAGAPNTLTEAVYDPVQGWRLAQMV